MKDVIQQIAAGNQDILGVMLESHIHGGTQKLGDNPAALAYGISITDGCIDWETTAACIREARQLLQEHHA